jgi:hypothetical protein
VGAWKVSDPWAWMSARAPILVPVGEATAVGLTVGVVLLEAPWIDGRVRGNSASTQINATDAPPS